MLKSKRKIGLALGGGVARGFAHIGVLKVLEEAQIDVDLVVGTSMGAVVGAFYCSGMPPKTMERLARFTRRNNWMDFSISRMGLVSGEKLEQYVLLLTRSATFAELKKPFAAVATDLRSGSKVVIKEGLVARAVRASAAIPGIFCPVEMEDMILVDGGVLERVPVVSAREMGADFVIAVDVGVYTNNARINNVFDVVMQSLDIMSRDLCNGIVSQADFLIRPDLSDVSPAQFNRSDDAVKAGEEAARLVVDQLKEKLAKEGYYGTQS